MLPKITVRCVCKFEEDLFQKLMQAHHYLGALPKIGNTIWYIVLHERKWLALLSFSASALKCHDRDRWIGWDYRHQYDRLHLVANNSRFLILPQYHYKNLASKILSLVRQRIQQDWQERFGYPLLLLETFVDPSRFKGTIYRAANWDLAGKTKGFRRTRNGYSSLAKIPKLIFVQSLQRNSRALLSAPLLINKYKTGETRIMLKADQMRSLPDFFRQIEDPRRAQSRQHQIHVVLAIAAGAVLCGMRGYKAISDWTQALSQTARARFKCRYRNKKYQVPSEGTIRRVLIRVNPEQLDKALQQWNKQYGVVDESLAIDGKTMCNAIDDEGRQTHIMGVVGHTSKQSYTQKKLALCR